MFTSLDLLVLVFVGLAAAMMISLCLMFVIKKKLVQNIFFYITLILGLFVAFFGYMVGSGMFPIQTAVAIITALACVGALVIRIVGKGNDKMFLIARVIAAAAFVIGFINAFIL